jgi:hypothetical protein
MLVLGIGFCLFLGVLYWSFSADSLLLGIGRLVLAVVVGFLAFWLLFAVFLVYAAGSAPWWQGPLFGS